MFSIYGLEPDPITVRSTHLRRAIICLALTTLVALPYSTKASADRGFPLTLAEAEDLALTDEPGEMAMLALASSLEDRSVAAGQLPDPTLRLGMANFPVSSGGFTTEAMTQAQVGIRQKIPRRKSRLLSTARFRELAKAQNEGADARSREVLAATRIAWLETFYWQQAEQVLLDSRPFFEDLVTVTESMYAVGRGTQYDVLRSELELSRLDDRLIDLTRSHSAAQAALSQWLGNDAHRPLTLKLPDWDQLPDLVALQQGMESHPLLQSAQADISARQASIGIAEQSRKPGWALDFGYGFRDGFLPNGEPRSDFVSVSVTVDLPLFKKNRQDRELTAALSERSAAQSNWDAIAVRLRSQLESEYSRWIELTRRIALYETRIVSLSENQAEAALLAYQSDAGDFSDVMMGHVDFLDARLEHLRLQVERAQSYAQLANLGGLPR